MENKTEQTNVNNAQANPVPPQQNAADKVVAPENPTEQSAVNTLAAGAFDSPSRFGDETAIQVADNRVLDHQSDAPTLIDIQNVSMVYRLASEKIDNLKEYAIKFLKRKLKYRNFHALKNVSITVRQGESLGLIGRNGAGKSTLLKVIAGIIEPTTGKVTMRGTIAPLINLGAGFDMNATAKENVFLNGAILGYSRKEMKEKYARIVEFAELSEFMNVPLKNFSSGMLTRLGFSIAVDVNPDILLVDEVLAVGDAPFRKKCFQRIHELKEAGTTYIIVSHDIGQIRDLCKNAVWLKDGSIQMLGEVNAVCNAYLADCEQS
jgi:ABC-2 type transport system ATP-binding protein